MRQRLVLVGATLLDGAGAPPAQGREALPYSILRRLSSTSQSHAAPYSAVQRLYANRKPIYSGNISIQIAGNRDPILKAFDLLLLLWS